MTEIEIRDRIEERVPSEPGRRMGVTEKALEKLLGKSGRKAHFPIRKM